MTAAYRWCSLYVDTSDRRIVVEHACRLFGRAPVDDVFMLPGFIVDVRGNPDRTVSDHFLDWRTMIDITASATVPDRDVAQFVTVLMLHLRAGGQRVAADCDFADRLPPPDSR